MGYDRMSVTVLRMNTNDDWLEVEEAQDRITQLEGLVEALQLCPQSMWTDANPSERERGAVLTAIMVIPHSR
ncbi:predicted protein [Coccidioides posadasii str. Silveira]|uniref:Predicted protein n=1 Tax=Coccidioides posadasii (strain RMSCC 757 / Silveira) TaxID=443226 RepID=E9CZ44_COCPS|nr:predicted protein [Coccidioides posadasii str. Silveira]